MPNITTPCYSIKTGSHNIFYIQGGLEEEDRTTNKEREGRRERQRERQKPTVYLDQQVL